MVIGSNDGGIMAGGVDNRMLYLVVETVTRLIQDLHPCLREGSCCIPICNSKLYRKKGEEALFGGRVLTMGVTGRQG